MDVVTGHGHTARVHPGERPDRLRWYAWRIFVTDPHRRAGDDVGDRTASAAAEVAGAHGAVYQYCVDDDELDGVPYYEWRLSVPRSAVPATAAEPPAAVTALLEHLQQELPGLGGWRAFEDGSASLDETVAADLRDDYADLLRPLEVRLLGLRRGGAQKVDPMVRVLLPADEPEYCAVGLYELTLTTDLDTGVPCWVMLNAGVAVGRAGLPAAARNALARWGDRPDHPILLYPRPQRPRFLATLTSGGRGRGQVGGVAQQSQLRWTSDDPAALAARVTRAVVGLFPQLDEPT